MGAYASSMGRIKAVVPGFLRKEQFQSLLGARDVPEVAKILEGTWYGPELAQAMAVYHGAEAVEAGVNRQFVKLNRFAYAAAPFAGRPVLAAYLRRWDIENIGAILAAKAYGRLLSEGESFLVSSRDSPAGLSAGLLGIDDLRSLLAQATVEGVVQQLVRFGYGTLLLQQLDQFAQRKDIFPLVQALERQYFEQLRSALKYFQGDEWVVRTYLAGEIDARNLLTVLKARDRQVPSDLTLPLLLDGGSLPLRELQELANLPTVAELVGAVGPRFPLADGLPEYQERGSLTGFDAALRRGIAEKNLARFREFPLSLAGIFDFLLHAELERSDLRRIVYGKVYGYSSERIAKDLVLNRLA